MTAKTSQKESSRTRLSGGAEWLRLSIGVWDSVRENPLSSAFSTFREGRFFKLRAIRQFGNREFGRGSKSPAIRSRENVERDTD